MRGLVEVMLAGAIVGAIGGLLLVPVKGALPAIRPARGLLLGGILFVGSCLAAWLTGMAEIRFDAVPVLTLGVVAAVYLIYGVTLDRMLSRAVDENDHGRRSSLP